MPAPELTPEQLRIPPGGDEFVAAIGEVLADLAQFCEEDIANRLTEEDSECWCPVPGDLDMAGYPQIKFTCAACRIRQGAQLYAAIAAHFESQNDQPETPADMSHMEANDG